MERQHAFIYKGHSVNKGKDFKAIQNDSKSKSILGLIRGLSYFL